MNTKNYEGSGGLPVIFPVFRCQRPSNPDSVRVVGCLILAALARVGASFLYRRGSIRFTPAPFKKHNGCDPHEIYTPYSPEVSVQRFYLVGNQMKLARCLNE